MRSEILFREEQRFRQPWIWILILVACLPVTGILGFGIVKQLILGQPWGDPPMSDAALLLAVGLLVALDFGLVWLFWAARLVTEVRPDGLHIRFFPFHCRWHKMPLQDLTHCEAKTYRPIREYGGWGIRRTWSMKGKAYNVSGNGGVRLDYSNGRHLLVGSQRPEELAASLKSVLGNRIP